MNIPEPDPLGESWTDSVNSPIFDNAVRVEIPPERRKVDPKTIWWPEGVPKPWEQNPRRRMAPGKPSAVKPIRSGCRPQWTNLLLGQGWQGESRQDFVQDRKRRILRVEDFDADGPTVSCEVDLQGRRNG